MTRNQLLKRLRKVEGKPLGRKVKPIDVMRRGQNYVEMQMDDSKEYDDFFEFEKDLAETELVPSRNLAASAPRAETFVEEVESEDRLGPGLIVMQEDSANKNLKSITILEEIEEIEPSPEGIVNNAPEVLDSNVPKYQDVRGFQFVQCEFIKNNGEQCKRQAPKGHTICSIHKKVLEKGK
jgi:hypothetical protein